MASLRVGGCLLGLSHQRAGGDGGGIYGLFLATAAEKVELLMQQVCGSHCVANAASMSRRPGVRAAGLREPRGRSQRARSAQTCIHHKRTFLKQHRSQDRWS